MIINFKIFEGINNKTFDPNAIYVNQYGTLVGKIKKDFSYKKQSYFKFFGYYIDKEYHEFNHNGLKDSLIYAQSWKNIREATSEEIEIYNYFDNVNNYNL